MAALHLYGIAYQETIKLTEKQHADNWIPNLNRIRCVCVCVLYSSNRWFVCMRVFFYLILMCMSMTTRLFDSNGMRLAAAAVAGYQFDRWYGYRLCNMLCLCCYASNASIDLLSNKISRLSIVRQRLNIICLLNTKKKQITKKKWKKKRRREAKEGKKNHCINAKTNF